jgi:hypothetical protein
MSTVEERPERALTIGEFCAAEHISVASYYKMRRLGVGPYEDRVPGTAIIRINAEARRAWHMRLAEMRRSLDAELEERRRIAHATQAGKMAAASAIHVSKRSRPEAGPSRGGTVQRPIRAADAEAKPQNFPKKIGGAA